MNDDEIKEAAKAIEVLARLTGTLDPYEIMDLLSVHFTFEEEISINVQLTLNHLKEK